MHSRRILVPVDFSDCTRFLVAEAARIARSLDAEITLLHVVRPPDGLPADLAISPGDPGHPVTVAEHLVGTAVGRLPVFAGIVRRAGVPVGSVVEEGPIPETILARADAGRFDMIVMGTHGRLGLARMIMGSVAEQVLRRSTVPVMTIRTEHRPDCAARSCGWCATHITPADLDAGFELDG